MRKFLIFACILIACQNINGQVRKSVSILGDSYSTFQNYVFPDSNAVWYLDGKQKRTDVTSVEQTWWHQLITNNGMKLEQNNSFSGATVCATGYRGDDYSNRSFYNRALYLGSPDIIFVFGATNDCWAKSPIGEFKYSGWTPEDLFTFRPAMACMLYRLLTRYPNTDLYFIMNCDLTGEITSSCRDICAHYNVKFIQLEGIDKISGHPSIKGMNQIAEQVKAALSR